MIYCLGSFLSRYCLFTSRFDSSKDSPSWCQICSFIFCWKIGSFGQNFDIDFFKFTTRESTWLFLFRARHCWILQSLSCWFMAHYWNWYLKTCLTTLMKKVSRGKLVELRFQVYSSKAGKIFYLKGQLQSHKKHSTLAKFSKLVFVQV
jgi:hypothetical protein